MAVGKRAGFVKKFNPMVKERCEEFKKTFEEMKKNQKKYSQATVANKSYKTYALV